MKNSVCFLLLAFFSFSSCQKSKNFEKIDVSQINTPCKFVDACLICCQDAEELLGKKTEEEFEKEGVTKSTKLDSINKQKVEKINLKIKELKMIMRSHLEFKDSDIKDCENYKKVNKMMDENHMLTHYIRL